ncbi:MAG: hypothetical protein R3Y23_05475 [Bacillota bacterium]
MKAVFYKQAHKKDEFKRVASSVVFVGIFWILFFAIFLSMLLFGILPLTPIYSNYLETVIVDNDDGTTYDQDLYQGYYATAYMGESNDYLTSGSLVYVRAYDPAINNLQVGEAALYYVETFDSETNILVSSELELRIITSFAVSDNYRYATVSSTDLNGENAIVGEIVRYDAMVGTIAKDTYVSIPVLGYVYNLLCGSVVMSVISIIICVALFLIAPIFIALAVRRHGYGMGNKNEQVRVIYPACGLLVSIILLIVVCCALYLPYYIDMGYVLYEGESATSTEDDVFSYNLSANTLYAVTAFNSAENNLVQGDIFAYKLWTVSEEEEYVSPTSETVFAIYNSGYLELVYGDDGVTIVDAYMMIYYYDLGDTTLQSAEIYAGDIYGTVGSGIPVLGSIIAALNTNIYTTIASLFLLIVLFTAFPTYLLAKRIRIAKRKSPFKDGLNTVDMNKECLYIYSSLCEFFESGNMTIKKGYDCDDVFINRHLFCKITCHKKVISVHINRNFIRYDHTLDRSGYIPIPHVSHLESAKDRINNMYHMFFVKYKVK